MSYTPIVILEDVESQPEKWMEARKSHLNASEFPLITGLTPEYGSPLKVWSEKLGLEPEREDSDTFFLGHALEPVIAAMVKRKTGRTVRPVNTYYGIKELPWIGATPDYIDEADEPILHQFKSAHYMAKKHWEEGIPTYAHIQTQIELACTGLKKASVDCLVGNRDFFMYETEFNPDIFSQLEKMGKDFWDLVSKKEPPIPTAEDAGRINRLIGVINENSIELPASLLASIKVWASMKEEESEAKKKYDELADRRKAQELFLRQQMGSHASGICEGYILQQKKIVVAPYQNKGSEYFRFSCKEIKA